MRPLRLRNARLVDPFRGVDATADVWIGADGRVAADGTGLSDPEVVDCRGLWVVPRVADLHVHFREPGQEAKEDIGSGSRAAAAGGITAVGLMPNTTPVVDDGARMAWVLARVAEEGRVDAWGIGAVTAESKGLKPADWDGMARAGARALSDDGRPVASSAVMAAALQDSARRGWPVIQHLEDPALAAGGVAHAGDAAQRLGLAGMPAAAESVMAWRDVALVAAYGGHLHFAHCSVPDTLEALAWARRRGMAVTGEAAPHHLLLSDDALAEWAGGGVAKVNPPLRPTAMRDALQDAVVRGVITVVASDHAPHTMEEKRQPFTRAPFGISGIETMLGVLLTVFVRTRRLTPLDVMRTVTAGPHAVVGEQFPGAVAGAPADLTLLDPDAAWRVDPGRFFSRGRNTPLEGRTLTGRVVATLHRGQFTFREGEVCS